MLSPVLVPMYSDTPKANILQQPEWGLIIDCKDRQNRIGQSIGLWNHSVAIDTTTWGKGDFDNNVLIGLSSKNASSTVDLTNNINFPKTGYYRIEIEVRKDATSTGSITLYDGSTLIEDTKSLNHQYEHFERIVYGTRKFTAGVHNLKITLKRSGYVANIFIYPINRITGGSVPSTDSTDTINVSEIEFTMNAMNEMDTCTITAGLKSSFWNGQNDSLMVFGFTDSVTLLLGKTKTDLTPMFGGYVLGPSPNDDMTQVTINCVSRFMDFLRQPTYHDFYIGTKPADATSNEQKYMNFASIYKLVDYLSTTLHYPVNTAGVPIDYGMMVNFADTGQFNSITAYNYNKSYDTEFGHPKPSIKITPGTIPGQSECILWQDGNDWDAAYYQMFNMDYNVGGAGAKYPLQFDLKFTMHTAGQGYFDGVDYIVRFTGTDTKHNVIGSVQQDTQNTWPSMNFNLKQMFDKVNYSTEYHITKVSMVGSITYNQVTHPLCSAIWIDQIFSYTPDEQAPQYTSSGVNFPFDEIQDLCTNTDHIVYIKPGLERRDDVVVVKPLETAITEETMLDGKDGNVLEITNWSYDPISDGYINQARRGYKQNDKDSGHKSYYEDFNSIIDNGPFQNYEFLDTVKDQASADKISQQYVQDHCTNKQAYTVSINGSTTIDPAHYIMANMTGSKITGLNHIKSITQTLDFQSNVYKCAIDLNQPSLKFRAKIKGLNRALGLNNNRTINNTYRETGLGDLATNSPGAFSQY